MIIHTLGNPKNPVIVFFHAMGVDGDSSLDVAEQLKDDYFCIMPTSTIYCKDQEYISKEDEIRQVNDFLKKYHIQKITLIVASSIGADLAMSFLTKTEYVVDHVFFDGGQFAQIPKLLRHIMTPFLYIVIKSLAWSKGKSLKYILWCHDERIKPYFIHAATNLTYRNLHRFLMDSVVDEEFPFLEKNVQDKMIVEFGSIEDHFKYRDAVMKAYPYAKYPIFNGCNHMQYQIKNPKGFANMLKQIILINELSDEAKKLEQNSSAC